MAVRQLKSEPPEGRLHNAPHWIEQTCERLLTVERRTGSSGAADTCSFLPARHALAADADTLLGAIEIADDDDALILYTSGTTRKPKGALFDHHRIMWVGVNVIATCGMRVEAVLHLSHDRRGVPPVGIGRPHQRARAGLRFPQRLTRPTARAQLSLA